MANGWWKELRQSVMSVLGAPSAPPAPGLYTYPVPLDGGQRRIHLRVEEGGASLLFIDVTDVLHLNATATVMAKMALDGVPAEQAHNRFLRRFNGVDKGQLTREIASIYSLVERFRANDGGCPVCSVADQLEFRPLFSAPVHAPYKADVALTYGCNNACAHCYNEAERLDMPSLALADWFRVLDKLAEIGVPHLILTGGEPTLHPDLPAIIRHADGLGLIVGMNTNGRMLAHAPTMAALVEAGLNHVQITLETHDAAIHDAMVGARGAFAQTVRGIENALASGIHTITNSTLTRQNQRDAVCIVDFLHGLGLRTFAMNGMIYAGGGLAASDAIPAEDMAATLVAVREHAEALDMRFLWYTVTDYCRLSPLELGLAPKRCNAAEYSICIEPNGDVLPCQSYYVAAGSLLIDPWERIWNSPLFLSFRDRETDPLAAGLPEACWDCPDLEMCGGGCRLEREAHTAHHPAEHGCARGRKPKT
ncbi:MAG TPA: radical SAM protein [Anaerolineae bacterium]|nr:radical SAM protein [Anaerolineae bacterium]HQI83065.1 radical SAM protein [Anaerolineae bacterium]